MINCFIIYLFYINFIGRAFGFGVTFLPHCDVVYSVPEATFQTPFMQWGKYTF